MKNFISKNRANLLAALILILMFCALLFSSRGFLGDPGDSATMDEVAHVPSSYVMIHDLDYRLNPEHPPLAKALAGISIVLSNTVKLDGASLNGLNEWDAGWKLLYGTKTDPAAVLFWGRLPIMFLTILLGLFLYKWASELFGKRTALIVLVLYASYPEILAHGRLVTTDVAAGLGFAIAIYYFNKLIEKSTLKNILLAGLATGIAFLFKFSAAILPIAFFLLILIRAIFFSADNNVFKNFKTLFRDWFFVCVIALILAWLAYIPLVSHTSPAVEHQLIESNLPTIYLAGLRNFLHLFESNILLRALGHFMLGLFLVFGRVAGGNDTFIIGQMSQKSFHWFFPVAWIIKTPIPIILLFFSTIVLMLRLQAKKLLDKKQSWILLMLITPFLLYWFFSVVGSLNLGIRHLIPTVPFLLLMIGFLISYFINYNRHFLYLFIGIAIVNVFSVYSNFPHFLSYFNESVPKSQRYQYMIDSSLDWGQDLLRLKKYVADNHIQDIKVDYFGGSKASFYMPESIPLHVSDGPTTGWLAISASFYQSSKLKAKFEHEQSYAWLDKFTPVTIIGDSILVYHISNTDLNK